MSNKNNPKDSIFKDDKKGQDKFAAMLIAMAKQEAAKIAAAQAALEKAKKK